MRIVTQAVVARSVDYGEADRICTLLTRDHGKLSAVARNARRSRKRYGGALSLFIIGEATLRTASGRALLSLERFESREDLAARVASDLVKVAHGSYLLELARELWGEGQPDRELFDLVCEAMRALACSEPSPSLLRAYELQLLTVLGLGLSLDQCVGCGAPPEQGAEARVEVEQGGVVCRRCGQGSRPLSAGARRTLLELQRIPLSSTPAVAPEGPVAREMRDLMLATMRHHLGKDLKSLAFLVKLAR
jgi:DNA repair protein RecO (recombination protein O)